MNEGLLFHEDQKWRDVWWVMALIFGLAALQWWIFFTQIVRGIQVGNNPGSNALVVVIWLIVGIAFPAFFLWLHMVVEVRSEAILIQYRPFISRRIQLREIAGIEIRVYRPLGEFGGWGVRGWGNRVAYNVSGNTGVELTLIDGRSIMIGSKRADELAGAIYKALGGSGRHTT
ncbi:MAG TPA: DUF6141 family protein [Promineifilum sp.]|nr:DUF6141 family protein [Promineifilum sp.]